MVIQCGTFVSCNQDIQHTVLLLSINIYNYIFSEILATQFPNFPVRVVIMVINEVNNGGGDDDVVGIYCIDTV